MAYLGELPDEPVDRMWERLDILTVLDTTNLTFIKYIEDFHPEIKIRFIGNVYGKKVWSVDKRVAF